MFLITQLGIRTIIFLKPPDIIPLTLLVRSNKKKKKKSKQNIVCTAQKCEQSNYQEQLKATTTRNKEQKNNGGRATIAFRSGQAGSAAHSALRAAQTFDS